MSRKISFSLSLDSIKSAIDALESYKIDIRNKCGYAIQKLADRGIMVAKQEVGGFGKHITFTRTGAVGTNDGIRCTVYAANTSLLTVEWQTLDGVKSVDISPILMAEFGSGQNADNARAKKFGMGTGTFPGQTHAEDPTGWWYMDLDGEWHHSMGATPTRPMYEAAQEIFRSVEQVFKEVFSTSGVSYND